MIAEQQVIDFRFEANKNVPLLFKARVPNADMHLSVEIYDSQGFPKKNLVITYGDDEHAMPFTPPETGTYLLRFQRTEEFRNLPGFNARTIVPGSFRWIGPAVSACTYKIVAP